MRLVRLPKPWLRTSHPGYYSVALGILFTHLGMTADAVMPGGHVGKAFVFTFPSIFWLWAILHAAIALALLAGLALPPQRWYIARRAFVLSAVTFNVFAVLIGLAVIKSYTEPGPHLSLYGPIMLVALSLSSTAAWREPSVQDHR